MKSYLGSLLRYGNPDLQFLGALKDKLLIHQNYDYSHYKFVAMGCSMGAIKSKILNLRRILSYYIPAILTSFSPFGTPKMTPSNKLVMRMIIYLVNLQFIFQGSQKLSVRVAISQKAIEVGFQFPAKIISIMVVDIAIISNFLGTFF